MVLLLLVGRLPLAITRIVNRNRILVVAAFIRVQEALQFLSDYCPPSISDVCANALVLCDSQFAVGNISFVRIRLAILFCIE